MHHFRWILRFLLEEKKIYKTLFATFFLILTSKFLTAGSPFIFRHIVSFIEHNNPFAGVLLMVIGYCMWRWLASLCGDGKDFVFLDVEYRLITKISSTLFHHICCLDAGFFLKYKTSFILSILDKGMKGMETFMRFCVFYMVPLCVEMILMTVLLWIFYPPFFACVFAMTIIAYTVFTFLFSRSRMKIMRYFSQADNRSRARAMDVLSHIMTVKLFQKEHTEKERFHKISTHTQRFGVRVKQTLALLNMGQSLILTTGLIVLLGYAAFLVTQKVFTVADFILMNIVIIQLIMPLHALGFAYREVKKSLIDITKMAEIRLIPSESHDEENALPLVIEEGSISFHNVCFGYESQRPILDRCSFDITGRQTVAIVGPTGTGKTTIALLLLRFFQPQKGIITVDGQPLSSVTRSTLRKKIGLVSQENMIFDGSIMDNIRYGVPDASLQEVVRAAQHASLHSMITKLPQGYYTPVGERGLKLSGGEKQRLAMARVFLLNPSIIIFDEATASLDNVTEAHVQKNIRTLTKEKTTIIIAHRLTTITHVDRIFVMDQGHVVQAGSHHDLLQCEGLYARLWHKNISA